MADETTGFGSAFSIGNPTTLVELGLITDMGDLPSFTRDLLDTTHFKTTGGFKTYIGAPLKDGTESSFVMNLDLGSASDIACRTAFADGASRPYKIVCTVPDGTWEITGNLVVTNYVRTNPIDTLRKATLTVKWSGLPTEAAGAGGGA